MFTRSDKNQSGQTLIETLVAIFMLTVAMLATVGSVQYMLQSSDLTVKQVTASGLAAEGIDIIKNERDNNWLEDTIVANCQELQDSSDPAAPDQPCYDKWLKGTSGGEDKLQYSNYAPYFDVSTNSWNLNRLGGSLNGAGLVKAYNASTGVTVYQPTTAPCGGMVCTQSLYSRRVVLSDASLPSMPADMVAKSPIVKITSTVWWVGSNCPSTNDPSTLRPSCKVILTDYITNWKNY